MFRRRKRRRRSTTKKKTKKKENEQAEFQNVELRRKWRTKTANAIIFTHHKSARWSHILFRNVVEFLAFVWQL